MLIYFISVKMDYTYEQKLKIYLIFEYTFVIYFYFFTNTHYSAIICLYCFVSFLRYHRKQIEWSTQRCWVSYTGFEWLFRWWSLSTYIHITTVHIQYYYWWVLITLLKPICNYCSILSCIPCNKVKLWGCVCKCMYVEVC